MINAENPSIIGLGIDQGIANCGFSVVELFEDDTIDVLVSGTIETKSTMPLPKRMTVLYDKITALLEEYPVRIIGCEKLFFNPKQKASGDGEGKRNKSASILYTNMATGLLCLIAGQKEIPLKELVPGTVKKYVSGNGRATKEELEEAVKRLTGNEEGFKTNHESDSVGIGITAVKYYKNNQEEFTASFVPPKKKKTEGKKATSSPKKRKERSEKIS